MINNSSVQKNKLAKTQAKLEIRHLSKGYGRSMTTLLVGEVEIRANEQCQISLGIFNANADYKSFGILVTPAHQDELITAKIIGINYIDKKYEYFLSITNYGNITTDIEIREIRSNINRQTTY